MYNMKEEQVNDVFDKILQKYVKSKQYTIILHDSKVFFDETDTAEDEHVYIIKIRLLKDEHDKKKYSTK